MHPTHTHISLDDIATFARVATLGSFSAAAVALGQPKSSVSRAVARLEDSLGVRLIERTTRRMRLTDVGSRYHDEALRALHALDEAADGVRQLQREPRGHLRVTAPVDGHAVLGPMCVAFQRLYPHVSLEVVLTDRMVDLVEEGFDVAIRTGELHDSTLVTRRLIPLRMGLFASPEVVARYGEPRSPDELRDWPAALFRNRSGEARLQLRGPSGTSDVTLRGTLSCGDFLMLRAALLAGAGVGQLPLQLAADDARHGRLRRVLPGWTLGETQLSAVFPSTRHLPAKVRAFVDHIAVEFRRHAAELMS